MIGAGYFAQHQLDGWQRVAGGRIVALCDLDAARGRALAERFGIDQVHTSPQQMLKEADLDFVDIVTRPDTHLELATLAAERGKAVLCQKPIAPDMDEARRIVAVCRDAGVPLMINENWRWQPWHRALRRLLDQGAVGRPFHARMLCRSADGWGDQPYTNQPYFKDMPHFILYEFVSHYIDVARFLFGSAASIQCVLRRINPLITGEDYLLAVLEMDNDVTVAIDANRLAEPPDDEPRTRGEIVIEGDGGQLAMDLRGRVWLKPLGGTRRQVECDVPSVGYLGDSCRGAQQHFIDCMRGGERFETDGEDYLRTFAAVWAGYRSADARRTVSLSEFEGGL
jgi:D-apiose dehydrogenase